MKLSVIIPVHNGGTDFRSCLEAIAASTRLPDEIIVVDDGSTDASAHLAREFGARVESLTGSPHGPAFARNRGAAIAQGDVLVFLDADVTAHTDTLERIEKYLCDQSEIAALFGSYDDHPPKPGLIARYKNLQHHYVHHHSLREASSFWAGCGAIRRAVFHAVGGFDERYARPSIEDIELGARMKRAGYRIWLCPDVQVAHLKRWTLPSLLRADIFDRAIPWTRLILSNAQMPTDLNLDTKSRVSALTAWSLLGFVALGFIVPAVWLGVIGAIALLIALNFDLYRFFARRGGFAFAIGAFGLHTFYFLYSSFVFGSMLMAHTLAKPFKSKRTQEARHAD
ncbi:Glycosyltransferase GlyG [Anaerolineae bacterium]|nr:Glycosyltransferase GlyG [Anaerolineae bacterium]